MTFTRPLLALALLHSSFLAAADNAAAADIAARRRQLHEPLFPIDVTPPPPAPDFTSSAPPSPDEFFPLSPPPPTASTDITEPSPIPRSSPPAQPPPPPPRRVKAGVIAVAAGAGAAAFILALFACFFILPGRGILRDRPTSGAGAAGVAGELIGSPYSKLEKERGRTFLEPCNHPSPELRPLPPLRRPSVAPTPLNRMVSSDEEAYFTPRQRSVESAWSGGSPNSPAPSRHSLPSISSRCTEKDSIVLTIEPSSVPPPRSQRTAPRTRFSTGCAPEIKQMIPPQPPPLPVKNDGVTRTPPVPPPPPPMPMMKLGGMSKIVPPFLPGAPSDTTEKSSRKRFIKSLPAEGSKVTVPTPSSVADRTDTGSAPRADNASQGNEADEVKPRLKPLHWDKVRAVSDRRMVWDQLSSGSFQLNEDMIEALFVNNPASVQKDGARKGSLPQFKQEEQVLDTKKAQNIAILLRALNVTRDEVSEALLDGNPECLGSELLETLVKMAPTKEEELKLRDYNGDISKLGSAERFLKTILDVPFAFKRVDAMLYQANFETEVNYLRKSYETLEAACEDLRSSRLFLKLLEAVLKTGNRMNVGTNRGEAKAFKLDTLLKLADVKGTDGKTTLLHFVVQEIIRSEESKSEESKSEQSTDNISYASQEGKFRKHGLKVVAGLSSELGNVKRAAGMDFDVLNSYLTKLAAGVENIKSVLHLEKQCIQGTKFFDAMRSFLRHAEQEIVRLRDDEKKTLAWVKEITEYFHGDAGKEEAHPLRIFMVVRDFLSTLDQVCRELGVKMQERTFVGSARSFRISASAPVPVFGKHVHRREGNSDEDSF